MDMYKGKNRFDREQLIFIVDVMITSCVDVIETWLPQTVDDLQRLEDKYPIDNKNYTHPSEYSKTIHNHIVSAKEQLGWNLSALYAQLTGDGMGTGDSLSMIPICEKIDKLVARRTSKRWKGFVGGEKIHNINTRKLATEFVKKAFADKLDDYLNI